MAQIQPQQATESMARHRNSLKILLCCKIPMLLCHNRRQWNWSYGNAQRQAFAMVINKDPPIYERSAILRWFCQVLGFCLIVSLFIPTPCSIQGLHCELLTSVNTLTKTIETINNYLYLYLSSVSLPVADISTCSPPVFSTLTVPLPPVLITLTLK